MTPLATGVEPPGSPRLALGIGVGVVVLVAGMLIAKLMRPSVAHVPSAMAGVKLESTLDEASAALPALEKVGATEYRARALVFDEPATCTVVLGDGSRVARIDCLAEPRDEWVRERLLVTLRELYGKESSSPRGAWRWQNDRALLELNATTDAPRISLWTTAHESVSASSH